MCGKNSTTTSTSSPNPQASAVYSEILNRGQNVSQLPFVPYGGQFVAPVNQQEQLAGANINAAAGEAQPFINQAAGYANAAAQPITAGQIQNYMNPYINDVVGATEAQFNQQNEIQQNQLTGNAAAQNALGGNRVGLAQAALAGQQQLSEAPTIAGLYNQGYGQALNTALAEQQQEAQAAYSLGNLGVAGQNAALQGAGAQLGYGQLGQQTQQQLDAALYNQFLAQQGYPFQTAQWLAGIGTGVGSQMGGTNVTQGPQPNPLNSIVGGGLLGLGIYNAIKDGGRVTGRNDGGRIANCGRAAPIAGFAMGGSPYSSLDDDAASGYVPSMQLQIGHTMPTGPGGSNQQQQQNPLQSANQLLGLGKTAGVFNNSGASASIDPNSGDLVTTTGDVIPGKHGGRISGFAMGGSPSPEFADGGGPDDGWDNTIGTARQQSPVFNQPVPDNQPSLAGPPPVTPVSIAGGTAQPAETALKPTPQRAAPVPTSAPSWSNPIPASAYGYAPNLQTIETEGGQRATVNSRAAPAFKGFLNDLERAGAPISDVGGYNPRNIAGTHTLSQHAFGNAIDIDQTGRNLVTPEMQAWRDAHPDVFSQLAAKWGLTSGENWKNPDFGHVEWRGQEAPISGVGAAQPAPQDQGQQRGFLDKVFGGNNPELGNALMAAGLGMMASRSPYFGPAVGEGGLAGLQAYQAQKKEAFNENQKVEELHQKAEQLQRQLARQTQQEQHAQDQIDIARKRLGLEEKKATPEYAKTMADARRAANPYDDETLETMARQYLAGDKSVTVGLGRNAEAMGAFRQKVNQVMRDYGISPEEQAAKQAEIQGDFASVRQLSVMGGKIDYSINEASKTFPMLLEASKNVPRSNLTDWNKLEQMVQSHTSSPELARLHTAIRATVTAYSQAMARSGQMTVHGDEESQKLLNAAMGHGSIEAIIDQMQKEMQAAKGAALQTTEERLSRIRQPLSQRGQVQPAAAPAAAPAAPAASPVPAYLPGGRPVSGGDPLAEARSAIAKGAPRDAVIRRLQEHGINPAGL